MEFSAENLPFLSLICIPAVGYLHRTLSTLKESALQQDGEIQSTREWLKNLDAAVSRRSELHVLETKIEALASRLERAETTIDRLRNGRHN
jgi:hypothetical protein